MQQLFPPLLLHVTSSNDNDNDNASNNNDNCNSDYHTNGYNDLIIEIIIIDGVYIYKDNDINIYNNYDNYNSLLPLRLQ